MSIQALDCPPTPSTSTSTSLDVDLLEQKQQVTWASGDFSVVGTTLQIVGESLCEAADICAGERVLDVACGNGNATLAAARRFAEVTGVDYVPSLLDRGRDRARAERLPIEFLHGNANALPFPDERFDAVLSTYGVMFTAKPSRAAGELVRVCRKGGRIALANWTPEGFIGKLLKLVAEFVPPPVGAPSPLRWGREAGLRELFGNSVKLHTQRKHYVFRYRTAEHFIDVFRTYYGPTHKAFLALDDAGQQDLAREMAALLRSEQRPDAPALAVPGEYLEVVIRKEA